MGNVLAGLIENKKAPLSELIDIMGTEFLEPISNDIHIAHGMHIKTFHEPNKPGKTLLAVYIVKSGFCTLDLENGIITNEYHENK